MCLLFKPPVYSIFVIAAQTRIVTLLQEDLDRYCMYKWEQNAKEKEQSETTKEFSDIRESDCQIKCLIEMIE